MFKAIRDDGCLVALKLLKNCSEHGSRNESLASLQELRHPHIVEMLAVGEICDRTFTVMEFMGAGSLKAILAKVGLLKPRQAAAYVSDVLAGLDYLHSQGVVCTCPGAVRMLWHMAWTHEQETFPIFVCQQRFGTRAKRVGARVGEGDFASRHRQPPLAPTVCRPLLHRSHHPSPFPKRARRDSLSLHGSVCGPPNRFTMGDLSER